MGYYTAHSLSMTNNQQGDVERIYNYAKVNDMDLAYGFTVCDEQLEATDLMKWYEHEENMREISREFPHILFELHGEGEESGDIWDEYYRDGMMQRCSAEIVIPPFDESKMK